MSMCSLAASRPPNSTRSVCAGQPAVRGLLPAVQQLRAAECGFEVSSWAPRPPPPAAAAAPPHRHCRRTGFVACNASERQRRDPSTYSSMDELREELEMEGRQRGGVIAGLVNWLGEAATSAGAATPLKAAYQWLLRSSPIRQPESSSSLDYDGSDLDPAVVQRLQALLLGSRVSTVRLIRKCPGILEMEWADLTTRLVGMKELFPGSDVARMVELAPAAFLDAPWPATQQQLAAASALLRRGLEGADVCFMFQEDPLLLFEPLDSLEVGLQRMRELWPGLTPSALADSEPLHLSLAVKALGLNGPPKGF